MSTSQTLRAIIVEDNPVLCDHLCELVSGTGDYEILGIADSVEGGLDLLKQQPDIALVDLDLIDGHGSDIISAAAATGTCKVLVVTIFADEQSVLCAFEAGADGFILKDSTLNDVQKALGAVMRGESPISAAAATHLLRRLQEPAKADKNIPAQTVLTPREIELLQLLAKGLSVKEVARTLDISHHTVSTHAKKIYRKMQVSGRNEAIFEAANEGWINIASR